ncbi:MAG: hypothetical protein JW747_04885 [Candidatus Aminicenantes bacterium]|nr:hypothetical protein [Candidatus Aminicenantes bacterium]
MKKATLRTVAVLVCAAFLVSTAPALQSAEKQSAQTGFLASLKDSFRVLAFLIPFFSPLADISKDDARNKDLQDMDAGLNLIPQPTSDSPSIQGPRTKD